MERDARLTESDAWHVEYEKDISWDRVTHIFTADLPCYFALLTRVHQQKESVDPRGKVVNSDVVPNVSVTVPPASNLDAAPLTMEVRQCVQFHCRYFLMCHLISHCHFYYYYYYYYYYYCEMPLLPVCLVSFSTGFSRYRMLQLD